MKRVPGFLALVTIVLWFGSVSLAGDETDLSLPPKAQMEGEASVTITILSRSLVGGEARLEPTGEVVTEAREVVEEKVPAEDVEKKRVSFTLENRINYDSNPEVVSTDEKEGWADVIKFSAGGRFFKKAADEIGGQYTFYGEFYSDVDGRDLTGHIGSIYYARISSPLSMRVDYLYSRYILDDETYLHKHTLAPMIFYAWGPKAIEMVRLALSSNKYPTMDALDGSDWSLHLRHFVFLDAERTKRLFIGYKYADLEADDDAQSYTAHRIRGDARLPLNWKMTLLLSMDYISKDFEGGTGRDDDRTEYQVEMSRPLGEISTVTLGHSSISNNSNVATADYSRNITFLSLKAAF